jgi:hypothetical protein
MKHTWIYLSVSPMRVVYGLLWADFMEGGKKQKGYTYKIYQCKDL